MKPYRALLTIAFVALLAIGYGFGQGVRWGRYSNSQFRYSIKYPSGWQLTEAKARRETDEGDIQKMLTPGELHKVSFRDTGDVYWQATLTIRILERPKSKTFIQWLNEYENSDTTDQNPVEQVVDTTVSGHPAKKAILFNFDHTGQELILEHKKGVLLISYEGENPNDKRNKWHREIFRRMIESFKMGK